MSRNYVNDETVRSNSSTSDQVHYLHSGTVRSKLIVLKPESTFTSESDRRHQSNLADNFHRLNQHQGDKRDSLSSYLVSSEPGPTHGRLPLLLDDDDDDARRRRRRSKLSSSVGLDSPRSFLGQHGVSVSSNGSSPSRCTRKLCLALIVAIVSVTFGAVVGVYFGFRILESETTKVKEFRGAFRVVAGDNYTDQLADTFSQEFLSRSRLYKTKLDTIFYNSVLKKAYLGSDILAIDPGETATRDDVTVRFNIRMDSSKIDADAGDIYLVLMNEIMKAQATTATTSLSPLTVDEESIEVHERRMKFSPNHLSPVSTLLVNRPNLDDSRMVTFASDTVSSSSSSRDRADVTEGNTVSSSESSSKKQTSEKTGPDERNGEDVESSRHASSNILESLLSGQDDLPSRETSTENDIGSKVTNIISYGRHGPSAPANAHVDGSNPSPSDPPFVADDQETDQQNTNVVYETNVDSSTLASSSVETKSLEEVHEEPSTTSDPMDRLVVVSIVPPKRSSSSTPPRAFRMEQQRKSMTSSASLGRRTPSKNTAVANRKRPPTNAPVAAVAVATTASLLPYLPILAQNRKCVSPGLNLCSTMLKNVSASGLDVNQRLEGIDMGPISAFIELVMESGCFEHADYFVCQLLQPGCDNGKPILPCQGFCQDFLDKCQSALPEAFNSGLSCNSLPDGATENCVGTPECVHQLRSKGLGHLSCDGVVDCHDMSDETRCSWCSPAQFVCGGKRCVDRTSRCDGKSDCPNGADERNCLALAASAVDAAHAHPYARLGYVFLNDRGSMGKICADTLLKAVPRDRREAVLRNVGESACLLLNYKNLFYVDTRDDRDNIGPYFHILNPLSWRVTFLEAPCRSKHVVYVECSNFACGKRPSHTPERTLHYLDKERTVALVDHGDYPWHAALYNSGHHVCDATLVAAKWLLTSATCMKGLPTGHWYARIGVVRLESSAPFQQRRRIIGRLQSPIKGSDLTLVRLDTSIELSDFVRPVCLPGHDHTDTVKPGKKCITLGWDYSSIFSERHLRQLKVTITANDECLWRWPVGKPHVICAKEAPGITDNCQGEEQPGGPLLCEDNGTWYLAGVINWRIGCRASKQPRLYDNVAVNGNWIRSTIENQDSVPATSREIVDM